MLVDAGLREFRLFYVVTLWASIGKDISRLCIKSMIFLTLLNFLRFNVFRITVSLVLVSVKTAVGEGTGQQVAASDRADGKWFIG